MDEVQEHIPSGPEFSGPRREFVANQLDYCFFLLLKLFSTRKLVTISSQGLGRGTAPVTTLLAQVAEGSMKLKFPGLNPYATKLLKSTSTVSV